MANPSPDRADKWVYIGLLAVTLAAHGLLVATDYVIWDGFILLRGFSYEEGTAHMWRWFMEAGRPLDYLFYRFLFVLPNPVLMAKLAGLVTWGGCGALIYAVLRRIAAMPVQVSGAVAVLATALPVFDLLGEVTFWTHELALVLFWAGWYLAAGAGRSGARGRKWRRLGAMGLLLVSFNLNSLLVFFYAVALVLFLLRLPVWNLRAVWREGIAIGRRHIDLAVLPILFWCAKLLLTPTSGFYADYNAVDADPERLVGAYQTLFANFAFGELLKLSSLVWLGVGTTVLTWLVLAFLRGLGVTSVSCGQIPTDQAPPRAWLLIIAGLLLLLAAAFPYLAVGQELGSRGWMTRNSILTPLPLALFLVGLILTVARAASLRLRLLWLPLVSAATVVSVVRCNLVQLELQGQGAKQASVAQQLRAAIRDHSAAVVQLRDYFPISGSNDDYPPAVWSSMIAEPGRPPSVFVFDAVKLAGHRTVAGPAGESGLEIPFLEIDGATLRQMIVETSIPFVFDRVPQTGSQIMFVVRPGQFGAVGESIGLRYLLLRWLYPEGLSQFVGSVVDGVAVSLPPIGS